LQDTRSYARTGAPVTKKGGSPTPKTGDGPDPKKEVKVQAKLKIIEAAQNLKMDLAIRKVEVSDDGARVAVELSEPNVSDPARTKVQVWDVKGNPSACYEYTGMLKAFSPDGKKLLVLTTGTRNDLIDVDAKKVTGQIGYNATYVHFLSPEAIVAIRPAVNSTKQNRLIVKVFNATDGKEESSTVAGNDDRVSLSAPFNQRGEIAIGVENENLVKIWDVRQKKVVREFEAPDPDPDKIPTKGFKWKRDMPVSSDGKLLVLGQPRSVEFWDALNGTKMYSVNSPFPARGAIVAPDIYICQGMYAGSLDKQTIGPAVGNTSQSIVVAYDLARGNIVAAFRGHPKAITAFAVSDNGKVMATGDAEGNLKIWDLDKLK
jgi:WD40 repeat protein